MYLLFQINSSPSNEPFLLSKSVYSVQNISWVIDIYSIDNIWNSVFITCLTCLLLSLYEWSFAYLWMWGMTHNINPVTEKSVLMCNCIFYYKLNTKELILSDIYESLIYVSSVSIFSSSSVSLSDEIHTFWDYGPDTGNSSFLSGSDDELIMDIFVILA